MKVFFTTFFNTLIKSCTDPAFYKDILKKPLSHGVKYLLILYFFLTLVTIVKFAVTAIPLSKTVKTFVEESKPVLQNMYPPELVITVTNGSVSTNVPEPYEIRVPQELLAKLNIPIADIEEPPALLVINTNAHAEDILEYNTLLLLTERSIVYRKDANEYRFTTLEKIDTARFDKAAYDELVVKVMPYIEKLPTILTIVSVVGIIFFLPFGALFGVLFRMLYLLVATLLILLVSSLMKKKYTYSELYRLAMFGATPILLLFSLFQTILEIHFRIPFLFTMLLLVWMGVVIHQIDKKG